MEMGWGEVAVASTLPLVVQMRVFVPEVPMSMPRRLDIVFSLCGLGKKPEVVLRSKVKTGIIKQGGEGVCKIWGSKMAQSP